jgi:hypothetical protein
MQTRTYSCTNKNTRQGFHCDDIVINTHNADVMSAYNTDWRNEVYKGYYSSQLQSDQEGSL